METVVISGYFDPLHVGHLEYIRNSRRNIEVLYKKEVKLIAIVNNDKQAKLKKGKSFMPENERLEIVKNIKGVDIAILSIDEDRTVNNTLRLLHKLFNITIFTNGGDVEKCAEEETCKELGINLFYGFGKKIQSSSNLINIK